MEAAIEKLQDAKTRDRIIEPGIDNNVRFSWSWCASEKINGYNAAVLRSKC